MKEMKIRIKSPEHSERVQQRLFKLGCKWASGITEVICTNAKALYVYKPDEYNSNYYLMWNSLDNEDTEHFGEYALPEYHLNSKGEFVEGPEPTLQELLKDKVAVMGNYVESGIDCSKLSVSSDSIKLVTIGMPVQVRSRKEVTLGRIKELAEGVKYCANKGETIPQDWLYELLELNSTLKDILSDESEEK